MCDVSQIISQKRIECFKFRTIIEEKGYYQVHLLDRVCVWFNLHAYHEFSLPLSL